MWHAKIERLLSNALEPYVTPLYAFFDKIQKGAESFSILPIFTSKEMESKLKKANPFYSSQLIEFGLENETFENLIQSETLDTLCQQISGQKVSVESLSLLNQCIEHGSERGKEASVIEMLQNSLDAIKSFDADRQNNSECVKKSLQARKNLDNLSRIEFQVELLQKDPSHLQHILKIRDPIGMFNLRTILVSFLIPGFSEKKGLLGEMGNGFFQTYRDAEKIFITTRLVEDPEKVYGIEIIPCKLNSEEINDAQVKIIDLSIEFLAKSPDFLERKSIFFLLILKGALPKLSWRLWRCMK